MKETMSRGAGSASGGKKIYRLVIVLMFSFLVLPSVSLAAATKTISGTIKSFNGSQIVFGTTSAATYAADAGNATLLRKNGASMAFSDFMVGDKVEVIGTLFSDNSISATSIRDLSLYAHNSSFTGKIATINTPNSSFTMTSKTYGTQTIFTNNFTSFSVNSSSGTFNNLQLGMTATAKGQWDRTNTQIIASAVTAKFKLINIYFIGSVSIQSPNSLTVIGNGNVIYGVDLTHATLLNKAGLPITASVIKPGDSLRVWGKHISGLVQIMGTKVIDSSITK